jgi:hypothetical protein
LFTTLPHFTPFQSKVNLFMPKISLFGSSHPRQQKTASCGFFGSGELG